MKKDGHLKEQSQNSGEQWNGGGTTRVQNTSLIKTYSPSTEQHLPSGISELLLASDDYEPPILLKFKYLL